MICKTFQFFKRIKTAGDTTAAICLRERYEGNTPGARTQLCEVYTDANEYKYKAYLYAQEQLDEVVESRAAASNENRAWLLSC
jgi:hypothetical protein